MGIAKRNISYRNIAADLVGLRHRDVRVCERGSTDLPEGIVVDDQTLPDSEPVTYLDERVMLSGFSTLAVTDMQGRGLAVTCSQSCADTGIHASAEEHNGTRTTGCS